MQTIRILSPDFSPIDNLTNYVSMMFTRSWHGVGDFQLIVHDDFAKNIGKNTLVALDKDKVGIIKHCEIQLDESGKASENWTFRGWAIKGIMHQRTTVPPANTSYDRKNGDAETVMKHYVDRHFVNPVNPARKVPNLVIAPNQNRGSHIAWQSRYKVVSEELEKISLATGLGWNITLDTENNQFVFDVFEGKDLSINQDVNSPVYFSPEFGNVKGQSFLDSDLNMRNVGYIGGQGEGKDREIIIIGDATGLDRFETFVDARDVDEEEVDSETLEQRGLRKMKELENELFFEAEIMSPITKTTYTDTFETFAHHTQPVYRQEREIELIGTFIYEQDYNLGDNVTIMNKKWDVIVDRRISEITEVYESSGFRLDAVFGQKRPTLISKLKSKFDELNNELNR